MAHSCWLSSSPQSHTLSSFITLFPLSIHSLFERLDHIKSYTLVQQSTWQPKKQNCKAYLDHVSSHSLFLYKSLSSFPLNSLSLFERLGQLKSFTFTNRVLENQLKRTTKQIWIILICRKLKLVFCNNNNKDINFLWLNSYRNYISNAFIKSKILLYLVPKQKTKRKKQRHRGFCIRMFALDRKANYRACFAAN